MPRDDEETNMSLLDVAKLPDPELGRTIGGSVEFLRDEVVPPGEATLEEDKSEAGVLAGEGTFLSAVEKIFFDESENMRRKFRQEVIQIVYSCCFIFQSPYHRIRIDALHKLEGFLQSYKNPDNISRDDVFLCCLITSHAFLVSEECQERERWVKERLRPEKCQAEKQKRVIEKIEKLELKLHVSSFFSLVWASLFMQLIKIVIIMQRVMHYLKCVLMNMLCLLFLV